MAFWSSQRVAAEQQARNLIQPFVQNRIQQGAYELSLSDQALTTPLLTASQPVGVVDGVLMIEPGQFGLLYTAETVRIPADVIAFISIKASIKFKGVVNVSGFHVDPGYQGSLQFSIYNAGTETVALAVGQPAFLIWFADLDQATIDPYGAQHQHANQRGITAQDRLRMRQPVPSPTALQRQLGIFEYRWEIFRAAAKYFILPAVAALLAGFVLWVLTTGFPNTVPFRDIKRLLRSLNEEQPQMTAPATTATPVLGSGQPPALRIEIATPSPAATQTASISPEPSISVKRSKHPHH